MPDQFDRTRWRRIAMRTVAVAATALAIGIAARWWFLHWQPDRARYPLRGIDVSHHQGAIDWRAVARDAVAFAYLKASEGGDHRDRRYAANARDARAAGVAVGAYHFFTFCRDGGRRRRTPSPPRRPPPTRCRRRWIWNSAATAGAAPTARRCAPSSMRSWRRWKPLTENRRCCT
nr:GH25 family lysozyme [Lysobacter enzymogenes]